MKHLGTLALTSFLAAQLACGRGTAPADDDLPDTGPDDTQVPLGKICEGESYELKPEFTGPCELKAGAIDVNLGNSATNAVRALHCQVFGEEPSAEVLETDAKDLTDLEYVRRIDLASRYCEEAGRNCRASFSDPWDCQVELSSTCQKKTERDVGAVLMFFSDCPDPGQNCGNYWANTHAPGMFSKTPLFADEEGAPGFYNPSNQGFWESEFKDARWAGVSFLLLNVYGPDLMTNHVDQAAAALEAIGGGVGLGLFDDTWGWGNLKTPPFGEPPDLRNTEEAAELIYQNKWKPFFDKIPEKHWYKYKGQPFIYFYNAGTLNPRDASAPVIARMKEMFEAEYGVAPFVAVDSAFFTGEDDSNAAADGRFTWYSFNEGFNPSVYTFGETTITHAMVRWDTTGRDAGGQFPPEADSGELLHKGPELLSQVLEDSADSDLTIFATWNDLGEGTGINRNYDYYHGGKWLEPTHFLDVIRKEQCSN